jgi:hypothetical protein
MLKCSNFKSLRFQSFSESEPDLPQFTEESTNKRDHGNILRSIPLRADNGRSNASGLGKFCGYGTLFQSIFEADFQRAADATIADFYLPPVVNKAIISHHLQSLRMKVFTELDDLYPTAGGGLGLVNVG